MKSSGNRKEPGYQNIIKTLKRKHVQIYNQHCDCWWPSIVKCRSFAVTVVTKSCIYIHDVSLKGDITLSLFTRYILHLILWRGMLTSIEKNIFVLTDKGRNLRICVLLVVSSEWKKADLGHINTFPLFRRRYFHSWCYPLDKTCQNISFKAIPNSVSVVTHLKTSVGLQAWLTSQSIVCQDQYHQFEFRTAGLFNWESLTQLCSSIHYHMINGH